MLVFEFKCQFNVIVLLFDRSIGTGFSMNTNQYTFTCCLKNLQKKNKFLGTKVKSKVFDFLIKIQ